MALICLSSDCGRQSPPQNPEYGCIDPNAANYDPLATIDNGTCCFLDTVNYIDEDYVEDTVAGSPHFGETVVSAKFEQDEYADSNSIDECVNNWYCPVTLSFDNLLGGGDTISIDYHVDFVSDDGTFTWHYNTGHAVVYPGVTTVVGDISSKCYPISRGDVDVTITGSSYQ